MASQFFSFVLFFVFSLASTAQVTVNLVPNPSFEEFENGCPINLNEMPIGWSKWRSSPNSFSTCVDPQNLVDSLGWAPWTGWGTQLPADGESFCGFYAFSPAPAPEILNDFREYLGCALEEPMEIGTTYYIKFKVSMAYYGNYYYVWWATNRLGAIFTMNPYSNSGNPMPIPNFAHLYTEEIIIDTTDWVTIEGSFIADSAYTHMALGVFFEYDLLETLLLLPPNPPPTDGLGSYYFVDDVCVSRFSNCQDTSVSINPMATKNPAIYPNPATQTLTISDHVIIEVVRIFNLNGYEMLTVRPRAQSFNFSISALNSGIYSIIIESKNKTKRERLVVVR
jgi:hypothetical protein